MSFFANVVAKLPENLLPKKSSEISTVLLSSLKESGVELYSTPSNCLYHLEGNLESIIKAHEILKAFFEKPIETSDENKTRKSTEEFIVKNADDLKTISKFFNYKTPRNPRGRKGVLNNDDPIGKVFAYTKELENECIMEDKEVINSLNDRLQTIVENIDKDITKVSEGEDYVVDESNSSIFKCKSCEQNFRSRTLIEKHCIRNHVARRYTCPLCESTFAFSTELIKHGQKHIERHQCSICDNQYRELETLKKHMSSHAETPMPQARFNCVSCNKSYSSKQNLQAHFRTIHEKRTLTFKCGICSKSFKQKHSLKHHLKLHSGDIIEKKHCCSTCGKRFERGADLKKHERIHRDERPYSCTACEKQFKHATSLRVHLKIHRSIAEFSCDVCFKKFMQKHSLERHKRIHSGEKPYKCSQCSYTFKDASVLRRHLQRVHKLSKDCQPPLAELKIPENATPTLQNNQANIMEDSLSTAALPQDVFHLTTEQLNSYLQQFALSNE